MSLINGLTKNELLYLEEQGLTPDNLEGQLQSFAQGFPPLKLTSAVSEYHGITVLSAQQKQDFVTFYEHQAPALNLAKFVPASGAASRMFRDIQAYVNNPHQEMPQSVQFFITNLNKMPFIGALRSALKSMDMNLDLLLQEGKYYRILEVLLGNPGLNYQNLPKLLVIFHQYADQCRTALEEHLVEGAAYARSGDLAKLHFTVTATHLLQVQELAAHLIPHYETAYQCNFDITFSTQVSNTNTIAVDRKNQPFRYNGEIVIRPGGHGALLTNLNKVNADLVFIKNVDNLLPDSRKTSMVFHKKLVAGILLKAKERVFAYLNQLDVAPDWPIDTEEELLSYLEEAWSYIPPKTFYELHHIDRKRFIHNVLNRPLRVVGVLRTQEPTGGGPYWVEDDRGTSLQLVESAQINDKEPSQKRIQEASLYANITDLVIWKTDYRGQSFDLKEYADPSTGFISRKSYQGHSIKALELPGLWNGAMAYWNTILVEVPEDTFAPVKSVLDLIDQKHFVN